MKANSIIVKVFCTVTILSIFLSGCGANSTATPSISQSPIPVKTEMPTATIEPSIDLVKVESPDCNYGGNMKAIEALDESTIKFTLCSPDGAFLSKIASPDFSIQSAKHLVEFNGNPSEQPLGTGAYMLENWSKGDQLILKSNPEYWGASPKSEKLIFLWNQEASGRLLNLKAGVADGADNIDPNDYSVVQSDPTLKLYTRPSFNIFYIGVPNTKPPFDNEKVRQAVAIGIDRQRIVDNFFPAGSSVADYLAPCEVPGGCVGTPWPKYDPEGAKKLLAEAGYPNGLEITLSYRDVTRAYLPSPSTVAVDIQAQLSEIGIKVVLDVQESSTFVQNSVDGNLGMHLLGWGGYYPDQTNFVDVFFGKSADKSLGNHWTDLEDKIAKAATLSDQAERNKLYAEINDLVVKYVPLIPVAHGASAMAFNASVENVVSSPVSLEKFQNMSVSGKDTIVFVQNLEPPSLYCADDTNRDTLRVCVQIFDSLYAYTPDGKAEPALAKQCTVSANELEWTCTLQENIKFSDGTILTANDVATTFIVQWDAANPLHVGTSGTFYFWQMSFGKFLHSKE